MCVARYSNDRVRGIAFVSVARFPLPEDVVVLLLRTVLYDSYVLLAVVV